MGEKRETRYAGALIDDVVDRLMPSDDQDIERIPSEYETLDEKVGGFPRGELTVLAGRPSQGKTILAQTIARLVSVHRDIPTAFIGTESRFRTLTRILLTEAMVPHWKWRRSMLNESDQEAISDAAEEFEGAPLYIDDQSINDIRRLQERVEQLKSNHNIELVIIDWLQAIQAPEENGRKDELNRIVRTLETLADEQDMAILLLSEISDAVEKRSNFRPRLSDVGETEVITQLADLVILMYREYYYTGNEDMSGITELIVAKNSRGPCGSVELKYDPNTGRFQEHFDPKRIEQSMFGQE